MLFIPSLKDYRLAKKHRLKERGFAYPVRTAWAARKAGVTLATACALQHQETGNGRNVYGHDSVRNPVKSPQGGFKYVTSSNYAEYKRNRKAGLGMQGVGPVQLTWFETQDHADALGGCWRPEINLYVGLITLKQDIARNGGNLWRGCEAYNGTGPAAVAYANSLTHLITEWHHTFGGDR